MYYLGLKVIGADSSACLIDTERKKILAVTNDRLNRIKKDNLNCKEAIKWIFEECELDSDINISTCFSDYSSRTQLLENAESSFLYATIERAVRNIYKPKFRKDLIPFNTKRHKLLRFLVSFKSPLKIIDFYLRSKQFRNFSKGKTNANDSYLAMSKLLKETIPESLLSRIKTIENYDHHLSHAYSAYFLSNFERHLPILVFTLDELGDGIFMSTSIFSNGSFQKFITRENAPEINIRNSKKKHLASVPSIYSNFTETLGLVRSSDEGKVEALAAYGKPNTELVNILRSAWLLNNQIKNKILLEPNIKIISKLYDKKFLNDWLNKLGEENFAATIQFWLEEFSTNYLDLIINLNNIGEVRLALAGGATANVIMNLKIYEKINPKEIFVAPPMGDEGAALGSAFISAINHGEELSWIKEKISMPYFGPSIDTENIPEIAHKKNLSANFNFYNDEELIKLISKELINGKVCAIARGSLEFGPRALGNRSIIALPTSKEIRNKINSKIKKRPSYQPFCPSVLEIDREELFSKSFNHKYMAIAFRMKEEFIKKYPSACHLDGTARPQFVTEKENTFYFKILLSIKKEIGHGILINTSFNLHGRSMVCKAEDAIQDYMDCNIDNMVLGNYFFTK